MLSACCRPASDVAENLEMFLIQSVQDCREIGFELIPTVTSNGSSAVAYTRATRCITANDKLLRQSGTITTPCVGDKPYVDPVARTDTAYIGLCKF